MVQLKNNAKQKAQQLETDRARISTLSTQIADSRRGKEDSVSAYLGVAICANCKMRGHPVFAPLESVAIPRVKSEMPEGNGIVGKSEHKFVCLHGNIV